MAKNMSNGGKTSPYAGNSGSFVKGTNVKKGGTGSGKIITPGGK